MLPGEIEPFADAHIEDLTKILDALHPEKTDHPDDITPVSEEEIYRIVNNARRALVRFKVCMADEVKQKNRYATYAKAHGYVFS